MEALSDIFDNHSLLVMKMLSKAYSSRTKPVKAKERTRVYSAPESHADDATLAAQVASGDTKMVPHTIYNHKAKSTEQFALILLHEQEIFLAANPDYAYEGYRTQDGKHGERTVYLLFKKKAE